MMAMHEDICDALLGYPLSKVVVLDTETTGLTAGADEILSVGMVDGYGNELLNTYVRPTRHRHWPEAQRVNHITPLMVIGSPTISQLSSRIAQFLTKDVLVVGYNVSFDLDFLRCASVISWQDVSRTFDVMREYARVHGERRWNSGSYKYSKLAQCSRHYGYSFRAHDALEDARATAYCFRALLCDPAYNQILIEAIRSDLTDLRTTQTNATKSNIAEALGSLVAAEMHGSLVVGEITRGKNKGRKRLECELDGKCVGMPTKSATAKVLTLLRASDPGDLDDSVAVRLALKASDSSYACAFAIEPTELVDEVKELSERDDPAKAAPRTSDQPTVSASTEAASKAMPPASVAPSSAIGAPRPNDTRGGSGSMTNTLIVISTICLFLVMLVPGVGVVLAILFVIIAFLDHEAHK